MHPFTCETVLSWLVLIQGCAVKRLAVFALIAEVASLASALYFLLPNLYHTGVYRVDIVRARYLLAYVSFLLPVLILVPPALRLIRAGAPGLPLLASAWSWLFIDALVLLRADFHFKPFFAEPLLVMFSLGAAAVSSILLSPRTCDPAPVSDAPSRAAWLPVLLVALLAAAWFYFVQSKALHNLTFGWMDAGLYYMRVKHTALGHGFLQETLARPPFYDHFDVGLVLLVPFYYLLPRFSLIMVAQAVFLAAVGPALYVYARGRGLSCLCASLVAVAALLFPSISQLAFSFSYGFHPVTLSLPAVILSIHFWQKRRWLPFAALALFACSMEETVFPLYAGIGLVSMLAGPSRRPGALLLTLSVALFLVITKVVMPAFAGAGYFQLAKYSHLGGSFLSILSSPFTRPDVFWSLILSRQSLTFMLLLLAPLGFLPLLAPRLFFYPVVVLVFVLLLDNADVKSISFQYQTLIIAAWLPAAVAGLDRLSVFLSSRRRIGVASRLDCPCLWPACLLCFRLPLLRPSPVLALHHSLPGRPRRRRRRNKKARLRRLTLRQCPRHHARRHTICRCRFRRSSSGFLAFAPLRPRRPPGLRRLGAVARPHRRGLSRTRRHRPLSNSLHRPLRRPRETP